MFQISEIAIASTKLSSMFVDSSQKSPKLRLWLIKGFKHKNMLLRYGFPGPKSTLSNCPVQFRICIALTGLQNLKGGMQYLVSLASGGVSIFGKQILGNQHSTTAHYFAAMAHEQCTNFCSNIVQHAVRNLQQCPPSHCISGPPRILLCGQLCICNALQ